MFNCKLYKLTKENILAEGFLILHEIDTQSIVSKHGIIIKPLKQILFFHPNYIQIDSCRRLFSHKRNTIKTSGYGTRYE